MTKTERALLVALALLLLAAPYRTSLRDIDRRAE